MSLKMPKFSWSWLSIPVLLLFWIIVVFAMDGGRSKHDNKKWTKSLGDRCDRVVYDQPRIVASPSEVLSTFVQWTQTQYQMEDLYKKGPGGKPIKGPDGKMIPVYKYGSDGKLLLNSECNPIVVKIPKLVPKKVKVKKPDGTTEWVVVTEKRKKPNGEVYTAPVMVPIPLPIEFDQKHYSGEKLKQSWATVGSLGPHVWQSFTEVAVGFLLACIASILLGFWAGFSKGFREFITPLNGILMSIPAIAWAPMMIVIFPDRYIAIVVVVYLAAVSPMIIAIMEGILTITGQEVRAARALGCRPRQLFIHIYIPASLPFITAGMRIGFSQAWRALVAAEIIGGLGRGLGQVVNQSAQLGDPKAMLLGIAMIGFLSYLFERLIFRRMEKHYEVWRLN